jgi:hypothetical protein
MTPRVRGILETRWEAAGKPVEGWIWTAPTHSGHVESSSLKKQHRQVFKTLAEQDQKNNQKSIRRFVLYSLRHTFLTRLGESGCDVWTLARIAGHSDIRMSARYVHPSEDAVLSAMARLGGHKIGHNEMGWPPEVSQKLWAQSPFSKSVLASPSRGLGNNKSSRSALSKRHAKTLHTRSHRRVGKYKVTSRSRHLHCHCVAFSPPTLYYASRDRPR